MDEVRFLCSFFFTTAVLLLLLLFFHNLETIMSCLFLVYPHMLPMEYVYILFISIDFSIGFVVVPYGEFQYILWC